MQQLLPPLKPLKPQKTSLAKTALDYRLNSQPRKSNAASNKSVFSDLLSKQENNNHKDQLQNNAKPSTSVEKTSAKSDQAQSELNTVKHKEYEINNANQDDIDVSDAQNIDLNEISAQPLQSPKDNQPNKNIAHLAIDEARLLNTEQDSELAKASIGNEIAASEAFVEQGSTNSQTLDAPSVKGQISTLDIATSIPEINSTNQQSIQQPVAKDGQSELDSNKLLNTNLLQTAPIKTPPVEPATIQSPSADNQTALPMQLLSKISELIQQMPVGQIEQSNLTPKQLGEIVDFVQNIMNSAKGSDLGDLAEKAVIQLSEHLGLTNSANSQNNETEQPKPLSQLIKFIENLVEQAQSGNVNDLDLPKKQLSFLQNLLSDTGFGSKLKSALSSLKDAAANASNMSDIAANSQTTGQPSEKGKTELNQYASRYQNSAASQNSEDTATTSINKSEHIVENPAKPPSIYDGVKLNSANTNGQSALEQLTNKNPMDFLTQLQANQSAQTLNGNETEAPSSLKMLMQNGKLSQNLPTNALAFQISKQINNGNSEFQLRLDPAELGRINIKLSLKKGGNVKAHMVVERNDVFELLQRDARALERALAEAGFDGEKVELEFSMQKDNGGNEFAENLSDDQENSKNNNIADKTESNEQEASHMIARHMPLHITSTGIDRII